ncbi:hypothetical protein EYF80_043661 [Liparis tanakae]|uniref:Uncharacterized protein n=1 Tax=Liparis tanakae TaxID=230148 RepID=A0A4Z2FXZ0_9TELE|nr:hypothetical protein EYF80_043661 [Liparis tanakae]
MLHLLPLHPDVQEQASGPTHLPLFMQGGSHTPAAPGESGGLKEEAAAGRRRRGGDPGVTPAARSGYSSAPAGTSVDRALLTLGMVAFGLVRLSAGRLGDDEDDDEEEVGVISLLPFDWLT